MKFKTRVLNYKDLEIMQDNSHFAFTLDSILLARFLTVKNKYKNICDFGTNNGIIPLIISRYTNANIVGIDINNEAVKLAQESVEMNNLQSRITILNEDIKEHAKRNNNAYDVVFCNPPFFKVEEGSKFKKKLIEVINARHEKLINLEEIIDAAAICLSHRGKLIMIHVASRFDEIIYLLRLKKFTLKKIQFVYSKQNQEAKKILIEAENQGNEGITILPPLYVHKDNEEFTDQVKLFLGD